MKIMQLDTKVTQELAMLRERIAKMTTELETYSDIDKLKQDAESKKKVTHGDVVCPELNSAGIH